MHQFGSARAFVEGDIIEDDDVALRQFRGELGFDVELEAGGVHRRVDNSRSDHAVAAQTGHEGLRLPAAEGDMGPVALAFGRPAGALGQSCIGRRLINEDQARQGFVEERLAPGDP